MRRIYSVDAPETTNRGGGLDSLLCVAASRLPSPLPLSPERRFTKHYSKGRLDFSFFASFPTHFIIVCFFFFFSLSCSHRGAYIFGAMCVCKNVCNASIIDYVIRNLAIIFAPQRAAGCHLFYAGVATA